MKGFFALAAAVFIAVPARAAEVAEFADFAAYRSHFLGSVVAANPGVGTELGLAGFNAKLEAPTARAIAAQISFFENAQAALSLPRPSASAQERIDRAVMLSVARSQLHELRDRKSYLADVSAGIGPYEMLQAQLAQLGTGARAAEDWKDIADRTAAIPAYLAAVQANLKEGASQGRQIYRGFVEKDGLEAGAEAEAFFGKELVEKARGQLAPAQFAALEPALTRAGRAAQAAYAEHAAFLKREILPRAVETYGIGEEEYAWKLKHELGIDQTPSELQRKGRELAEKITARMEELAKSVAPGKSLSEIMAALREDKPKDDAELLKAYRETSDRARDFVVQNKLFAIPADYQINVIETPAGMRSRIGSAAYYPAPPLDPSKKGVFLVTPSGGDAKRLAIHNFTKIPTTVVHEAFPGHDMQFWSFQRDASISPVRHLASLSGFAYSLNVEGYAHYAEELMRARGFFTPKEELTQLAAQLWRAWRIVLDVGLHTGQFTQEEVAKTLAEKALQPASIAAVEAYRYARIPTQAITYLLGRLQIEEIKAQYAQIMGADYSEAEFHRLFLGYGPVLPALIKDDLLARAGAQRRPSVRVDRRLVPEVAAPILAAFQERVGDLPEGFEVTVESHHNPSNPLVILRGPRGFRDMFYLHEAKENVREMTFRWWNPATWLPRVADPDTMDPAEQVDAVVDYARLVAAASDKP